MTRVSFDPCFESVSYDLCISKNIEHTSELLLEFSFLFCSSVLLTNSFCGLILITLDKLCIVSATTEEVGGGGRRALLLFLAILLLL